MTTALTPGAAVVPRPSPSSSELASRPDAGVSVEAIRDFDFLHGEWIVANRRAAAPFAEASAWHSFHTIHTCRPLLGGSGNVEETVDDAAGSRAILRFFDLTKRRWTVYPVSSHDAALGAPLLGRFENGIGTFTGKDAWRGTAVLVRETWARTQGGRPHCEWALSADGGVTWATTWAMDYTPVSW